MIALLFALALVASAEALCGTAKKNLSCMKVPKDFELPINTPCSLPQCQHNKLPWSIFFQVCQELQTETQQYCAGSMACQSWPGETASLGQYSTVTYQDATGGIDGVVVHAGQGTVANGIARSMVLTIECAATSEPYPTFMHEATSTLEYSFNWKRKEACGKGCEGSGPAPPGPPGPGSHGGGKGMSLGGILLIVIAVVIVVYLVGGMIFMAVVKGARG
eukprot:TRINITY_DN1194_c0_g1_i1.p1 TRINITY_DN1194_c0_g1~~TRINITY_DN1194_c0_g1_i1.p1  ORF type:complete len:234 (-),score=95.09 TRINITY_DN1194_c0_g1_i1:321-977(-)